ncbi:MAG: hypothetical protein ABSG96_02945 [Terracidiphilus sp.]|jgi:hypothetical protein
MKGLRMRKLVGLIAMVGMAVPVFAAKRATVAELEQKLAAVHGAPDADAARQLSDLELHDFD